LAGFLAGGAFVAEAVSSLLRLHACHRETFDQNPDADFQLQYTFTGDSLSLPVSGSEDSTASLSASSSLLLEAIVSGLNSSSDSEIIFHW
jgi:hypothetical protein